MSISSGGSIESTCKIVPQAVIFKIRGNDKSYEEALEASVKFNKSLSRERKMRIPFIDSQTRVAQTNSMFWLGEYQRSKPANQLGNVYTYPSKKWYKHRRLELDSNDINYLFPRHHFQTMNQQSENGTNGVNSYHSNLNGNLLNENSNSMDSFHYNTSSSNHTYTSQMLKQASNSTDDYGIGNSNDEWSHNHNHNHGHSHNQQQSSHMLMHEDSFENFDANNDDDSGGDPDDDDPSFKKKKVKKTKTGRKKLSELGPDDKPYSCEKCGVKYKTRPGLNYHVQKAHNNGSQNSTPHTKGNKHHIQNETVLNPDENTTNSVFESAYDDMNSSSSLPQISNNNHQAISFSSNPHQHALSSSSSSNNVNNYNLTNSLNNHNNNNNLKNSLNRCGICTLNTDAYDGTGKPSSTQTDKFVACGECLKSFHSACLKFSANMVQSIKKYSWQCVDCKKCTVCGNSENDDKLLFCDDCDRGYHMYCLKPPMSEAPAGDWSCELCVKNLGNQ